MTETTDRNDGVTLIDANVGGALIGSSEKSIPLSPVSGGVGGTEVTGENAK